MPNGEKRELMKVENTVLFAGNGSDLPASTLRAGNDEQADRRSLFAGGLGKVIDPIEQKRQQAQKQAMKIVGDAWGNDQELEARLDEKRNQIKEYRDIIRESNAELDRIEKQRSDLREVYGVTEDSQEQKDLDLLVKRLESGKVNSRTELSDEEKERLAQIDGAGLTDYQRSSLELYKNRDRYELDKYRAQLGIEAGAVELSTMKVNMLKNQGMLKAQDAKDEVLEAASDQIVGMLVEEAKEHMDEELEEKKEAAEEKAEEEEIKEEQIEKRDAEEAREEQLRETFKQTVEAEEAMSEVQKEIQKIMDEMKLLDEDLKGAAVDAIS